MASGNGLQHGTPESQGVASSAILRFIEIAEEKIHSLHSIMLLRHGKVIAEGWWQPYAAENPQMLFSLSKSFTSTGIGLAVAEGLLSIDDPVLSFFPNEEPAEVSVNLANMRVRHLLTMTTGHDADTLEYLFKTQDKNWSKAFLELPVKYKPGTHFLYNSGSSYMLSAIVQKVTGKTLLDYLEPRLFKPLGIEGATWDLSPQGVTMGGFGLSIRTEDIARFGQLLLQKGSWNGRQILQPAWVEQATAFQVPNGTDDNSDWAQGYGFQFWRNRHGTYRGDGACGQFCLVLPEQDAVLAITAGVEDMQVVLDVVWDILLPAMQPVGLPADPMNQDRLAKKLDGLILTGPQGEPTQTEIERVHGRLFEIADNSIGIKQVCLDFSQNVYLVRIKDAVGEESITCGVGHWHKGQARLINPQLTKVAAQGAWTDSRFFSVDLCFYETPFTMKMAFHEDRVRIEIKPEIILGELSFPILEGKLATD